jgi:signal transduction histidine kinase
MQSQSPSSITSAADSRAALPQIPCVDDEPEVLEALCNVLHRRFCVASATSGREGLRRLTEDGPFAVVMSDFAMPGMNGAEFLSLARVAAPETVRVLLTGQASVQSAIAAVNDGRVFRLLTKPCSAPELVRAIEDAVDQWGLITSDRALLEHKLEALAEHLRRAERLASLGTMAAVVGHELNNVLTMLTGAMQFIRDDVAEGRLPSTDDLSTMQHARDCLETHAKSLLRLGRPVREGEPRVTDLGAAVHDVIGELRTAGLLRRVQVLLEPPSAPILAAIGKTDLEQVLMNLLKNAVEALSEAQRAERFVRITIREDHDRAVCVMADNANGIPAGTLPLIFEPYYTTKPPDRGTGLGLFGVRQVITAMHGTIDVRSTEGIGTEFTVTLPLARRDGSEEAPLSRD